MGFQCPECSNPDSLEVAASIELPADIRSDEIILQVISCPACGFYGLAVYEESRRGALDSEAWDHTGFRAPAEIVHSIQAAIGSCSNPFRVDCRCSAHNSLGRTDDRGRWQGPADLRWEEPFPMLRGEDRK